MTMLPIEGALIRIAEQRILALDEAIATLAQDDPLRRELETRRTAELNKLSERYARARRKRS